MSGKITTQSLSKLFAGLSEYLDSKYRGQLYYVRSFSIKPACEAVDNFLSAIYAVHLTADLFSSGDWNKSRTSGGATIFGNIPHDDKQNEEALNAVDLAPSLSHEYRLVCKTQVIEDEGTKGSVAKYYWNILFTKEKTVYSDVLERLEELAKGYFTTRISPKMYHYYSEGEDYACIILDDLVSLGFYTPKTKDLTFQECQVIFKGLARLHALSLVLESTDGCSLPQKYEICTAEMLFSSGVEPASRPMTYNSFLGFLKLTEKFRKDLLPHLKRMNDDENVWARLCELVKPGQSSFSCFCHGDPRLNNIFLGKVLPNSSSSIISVADDSNPKPLMTKTNANGQVMGTTSQEPELRFIDFQLSRYASPVTDLQYAIFTGTSRDFREKHTDTLLQSYYNEFQAVLSGFPFVKLLQADGIGSWNLETLKKEYEQFYMFGFLVSVILLPMILLRPGDIDKSMNQMTRAERDRFFGSGRIDLVCDIGSKNESLRERLFEICDEMIARNVIPTTM